MYLSKMHLCGTKSITSILFVISEFLSWIIHAAAEFCEAYVDERGVFHGSFHCPDTDIPGYDPNNIFCCGTSTEKHCCSKPSSYFLEDFNIGAFVGGSIAIVVAVIVGIILCCCCCSCCFWNRRQKRRRTPRGPGAPGAYQSAAMAYSTYPGSRFGRAGIPKGPGLFGIPLSHIPVIRHLHAPRTAVSTPLRVHEAPRPAPPTAIPKSYPKQQYSPMHSPMHSAPQPYTQPPISTAASAVPVVTTAGVAGSFPSTQLPNLAGYPPQPVFAPPVGQMQPPPPYVATAAAASQMMQAPPTAPPETHHRPPATNPHYHGNM